MNTYDMVWYITRKKTLDTYANKQVAAAFRLWAMNARFLLKTFIIGSSRVCMCDPACTCGGQRFCQDAPLCLLRWALASPALIILARQVGHQVPRIHCLHYLMQGLQTHAAKLGFYMSQGSQLRPPLYSLCHLPRS